MLSTMGGKYQFISIIIILYLSEVNLQSISNGKARQRFENSNDEKTRVRSEEDLRQNSPASKQKMPLQQSKYNKLFGYQAVARNAASNRQPPPPPPLDSNNSAGDDFVCAQYCSCSTVQVTDRISSRQIERRSNLSRVVCESSQFTDLLTIDRRTQIIHISLLAANGSADEQKDDKTTIEDESESSSGLKEKLFRMPRLAQFNKLREIIIIKLKFEVCDSEVFKRGQKLLRFRLNHNQLIRISKSCLKHLDKLIELNLDYNKLSELESALFSSLISLRSLSIAHNQLSELAAHQFVNLSSLTSLNLVGNSFKTINLHLFEPMQASLRLLLLAKNQIRSFIYSPIQQTIASIKVAPNATIQQQAPPASLKLLAAAQVQNSLAGLVFKNLIKLNVDQNKLERIKLIQLHRFYNVKYLSIRRNEIATIRDKAFNGLKLIELNLAHNQLQTISKCAFCNSTIRRLVLSYNNISLPMPNVLQLEPTQAIARPLISDSAADLMPNELAAAAAQASPSQAAESFNPLASSSQNMLILSQSIFGPLFGQLEYLDLSNNQQLASQLDFLLEPLLKLEFLNLASVGLEQSLPSPGLFKNLRQLRYLNLSHNQLDQLIAETVEPLNSLEILDLSHNKFSELDESFLVTIDEISSLKMVNFGSNPWYCSQCKVAPLYDWILRSQIYNMTCISPLLKLRDETTTLSDDTDESIKQKPSELDDNRAMITIGDNKSPPQLTARGLIPLANNFDKILEDIDSNINLNLSPGEQQSISNYNLLSAAMPTTLMETLASDPLIKELATDEDDPTIGEIIDSIGSIGELNSPAMNQMNFDAREYCLKCEFPNELSAFHIHELTPGDFKFCAGSAPRFSASEPKIGLTLAIVIIGALFCIIIIVIVMYRKKSNTYYPNEDLDQLDSRVNNGGGGGKKPVFSISSDNEQNQYGDATDYSSPPMSHSTEFDSQEDEDDYDDDEDEDEDEEDGQLSEEENIVDSLDNDDDDDDDDGTQLSDGHQLEKTTANGQQQQQQQQKNGFGQQADEAKRQRRNQIDEYNRRDQDQINTEQQNYSLPSNSSHSGKQMAPDLPQAASPSSAGDSKAAAAAAAADLDMTRADSLLAASKQPAPKSMGSPQSQLIQPQLKPKQQASADSITTTTTSSKSALVKMNQPDHREASQSQSHSQSTLVRNQSHPQHKIAFAEQAKASEHQSRTRSQRKSRSKDNNSVSREQSRGQLDSINELATNRKQKNDEPTSRQESAEKLDKKKSDRAALKRLQTNQSLHQASRSTLDQPQPQLQQSNLAAQESSHLFVKQPANNRNKHDRARQRFAISKEISQTMAAAATSKMKPSWASASVSSTTDLERQGRPHEEIRVASRQMAPLDHSSLTESDATTADSSALEQQFGIGSELLDEADQISFGSAGGALAMDDEPASLDGLSRNLHQSAAAAANQNEQLRPGAAISSHSALTQTGSGDLLD